MVIIEEYSGISQLLPTIFITNLQRHQNQFKRRFVVLEVVKLGFWKYNIFVKWRPMAARQGLVSTPDTVSKT